MMIYMLNPEVTVLNHGTHVCRMGPAKRLLPCSNAESDRENSDENRVQQRHVVCGGVAASGRQHSRPHYRQNDSGNCQMAKCRFTERAVLAIVHIVHAECLFLPGCWRAKQQGRRAIGNVPKRSVPRFSVSISLNLASYNHLPFTCANQRRVLLARFPFPFPHVRFPSSQPTCRKHDAALPPLHHSRYRVGPLILDPLFECTGQTTH
jgi:hypothetical protein